MIIDADTHISPTLEKGVSIGADELLRRMDHAGVDMALTWLQPPYLREIEEANRYVYEAEKGHPDRILGFGWVDPHFGAQKTNELLKKCIFEYGFRGVKLNGAQNEFYIDDPELSLPLIEQIAENGRILAFHVGGDAYEHTHPFRVAKIARMFPDLKIIAVHMGGASFKGLSDAMIELAKDLPNITLVGSAVKTRSILKAIQTLGSNRVCFGSDTPFELMDVEMAKYNALLSDRVTPEDKANIMGENIKNLFGLS